jgi:hypothetical protein
MSEEIGSMISRKLHEEMGCWADWISRLSRHTCLGKSLMTGITKTSGEKSRP